MTLDELKSSGRATITVDEASRLLGIGRRQGYEAVSRGELPCLRLGRRLLVPVPALLSMLSADITSYGPDENGAVPAMGSAPFDSSASEPSEPR